MKILLINNNPVVSRLTALSARKENVEIDEIKTISELKASNYNIIFVDGESYNNDVSNIIRNSGVEKRVLFYTQGDDEEKSIFTQTILKPFLPSEVSEILRETKVEILKEKEKSKASVESVNFNDLVDENKDNDLEILNIMDKKDIVEKKSEPSINPVTALAATATATATAATATIITEKKDKFDDKLNEAFPINLDELDEVSDSKVAESTQKKSHEKEMFNLDNDLFELDDKKATSKDSIDSDLFEIDDKIDNDLFEIDKEIKKDILGDAPLDFDIESKNEVSFEPKIEKITEPKTAEIKEVIPEIKTEITTKVLDNSEIANIKDILDEKEGTESLTAVPPSLMSIKEKSEEKVIKIEKTEEKIYAEQETSSIQEISEKQPSLKKKKKKKKKSEDKLSTGAAIAHTLSKLPVEDLRKLLRGAKVNVSIEFPNEV